MKTTILVIDDDPGIADSFVQLLETRGYHVVTAARADDALARYGNVELNLVITDVCMPGMNGLDALDVFRKRSPRLPVVVMTGQGSVDTAIESTKRGAFDYLLKPIDPNALLGVVEKAIEGARLMRSEVALGSSTQSEQADAMVGLGTAMQAVYKAIGRVAPTDATVLIRGESGTGKELVARAIYQHSLRAQAPLIVVNCAAIPPTLLESELFGHERGAFSGAVNRRIGRFEQANGGTIFLDEIGDLPIDLQAKLLRVLQERTFDRIGGPTVQVNVRVLAATNRDLEVSIREGIFREDLFHRLNVVTLRLPPLRERRDDIPSLVGFFVERYARELQREPVAFSAEAMKLLVEHSWLGNVRELQHFVQRLLIFCQSPVVRDVEVEAAFQAELATSSGETDWQQALVELIQMYLGCNRGDDLFERFVVETERTLLSETLRRTEGNQTLAARFLGLTRSTLQAKVTRLGLREIKPPPSEPR